MSAHQLQQTYTLYYDFNKAYSGKYHHAHTTKLILIHLLPTSSPLSLLSGLTNHFSPIMSVVSWKTFQLPKTLSSPYTSLKSNICEAHPHFLLLASQRIYHQAQTRPSVYQFHLTPTGTRPWNSYHEQQPHGLVQLKHSVYFISPFARGN